MSPPKTTIWYSILKAQEPKVAFLTTCICTIAVMSISQIYWKDVFGLRSYLPDSRYGVVDGLQIWRLFTSNLIHQDGGHLSANLMFFVPLGYFLCKDYGFLAFPVLPFTAMTGVNFIELLTHLTEARFLGASGVVYFMGSFWLTLFCFSQRRLKPIIRVFICIIAAVYFLLPPPSHSNIDYRCHVMGAVFGFTFGVLFFVQRRKVLPKLRIKEKDRANPP